VVISAGENAGVHPGILGIITATGFTVMGVGNSWECFWMAFGI
jgi:hypothetical protein